VPYEQPPQAGRAYVSTKRDCHACRVLVTSRIGNFLRCYQRDTTSARDLRVTARC
jgi:hypothetical protein